MSSLLVAVTVASLAALWSHWASVTQCPLLSHSIPECSMAAVDTAQLGFFPAVLPPLIPLLLLWISGW